MCPEITKFWGLFSYKLQWGLTIQGWLFISLGVLLIIWLLVIKIHPFLTPNQPIDADILLVEGWIDDDLVKEAIAEFYRGNYQLIITTGCPLIKGHFLAQYKNFADLTTATLIYLGFDQDKIVSIPSEWVQVNRTYNSALAVRNWLLNSPQSFQGINIYSYDVHTRRSWLLYRQTLSPEFQVGVIGNPSQFYDPQCWWTSSAGVRTVIPETIAYLYVKLFNIFQ